MKLAASVRGPALHKGLSDTERESSHSPPLRLVVPAVDHPIVSSSCSPPRIAPRRTTAFARAESAEVRADFARIHRDTPASGITLKSCLKVCERANRQPDEPFTKRRPIRSDGAASTLALSSPTLFSERASAWAGLFLGKPASLSGRRSDP